MYVYRCKKYLSRNLLNLFIFLEILKLNNEHNISYKTILLILTVYQKLIS